MGCLRRYVVSVDGTIPVRALLYDDEDLLASQESVGIYDGPQKSARHQSGTVHSTTHRLFYIDNSHPRSRSFSLDLLHVSRTEYYAGLFTSSAKITLYLHPLPLPAVSSPEASTSGVNSVPTAEADVSGSWECEVCNFRNPPGLSPTAPRVCTLCGVPQASVKPSISGPLSIPAKYKPPPLPHSLSTSLPSSSANLALSSSAAPSPQGENRDLVGENGEISCPACTFFNHPSLPACEICGTTLPRPRDALTGRALAKSAPSSRPTSPSNRDDDDDDGDLSEGARMIRVSFRKGGDKPFYAILRRSLLGKAWETSRIGQHVTSPAGPSTNDGRPTMGSGINGLMRTAQSNADTARTDMENALQDLEALMIKAKDMVRLASDLNERLTAATAAASNTPSALGPPSTSYLPHNGVVEPEEATFIRSSLAQLGLQMSNAPVTLDMIKDERTWSDELARELAGILQGMGPSKGSAQKEGMMKKRGIIGLDEVWGGWNRARGVALIPPSTLLSVLPHLPAYTSPPVHMRSFSSGLSVLHTPPYTKAAFASRVVGLLSLVGPRTTVELAQEEQLPIALVQEMVQEVEDAGEVCRDEGGGGINVLGADHLDQGMASRGGNEVRWWANIFRGYVWDGQLD